MKKAILLVSILFLSVISTACINNFAVQELNSKAQEFMAKGDYQAAIERLKSSIDLDDSIFETHYNLAVAYTNAEDYLNAIDSYKNAININSDKAETYYSLAVAQGNLIVDLNSGNIQLDDNGEFVKAEDVDFEEYKPSDEIIQKISELKEEQINN